MSLTTMLLCRGRGVHIETPRLSLQLLSADALRAIAAGALDVAARLTGCDFAAYPEKERSIAAIRLRDLEADPDYGPWSLRAVRLKPDLRLVGHFNFHTPPKSRIPARTGAGRG